MAVIVSDETSNFICYFYSHEYIVGFFPSDCFKIFLFSFSVQPFEYNVFLLFLSLYLLCLGFPGCFKYESW